MEKYYTIQEFSKLTDIPVSTIKYYDKIGLLHPAHVDTKNQYRYYTLPQCYRLIIIRDLREAGTSLTDIKEFLENQSAELFLKYVRKQIRKIDDDIFRMRFLRSHLYQKMLSVRMGINSAEAFEEISIRHEKETYALSFGRKMQSSEDAELAYLEIERMMRDEGLTFLGTNIGVIIPQSSLLHGDSLRSSIACLMINEAVAAKCSGNTFVVKEGDYVTAYHQGTFSNRDKVLERMLKYIEANKYRIIGDGIQRILIDEFITPDAEKFKYQIQIPVERLI